MRGRGRAIGEGERDPSEGEREKVERVREKRERESGGMREKGEKGFLIMETLIP